MKSVFTLASLLIASIASAQSYNAPESVVFDPINNRYFISNNGTNQILARDSAGTLSVFTSLISSGPNGLEIAGNTLYACDGGSVKGFDLAGASQVMNLNVGGTFLNGICTDGTYLYVTDFTTKKIFKIDIAAQTFTVFVTGLVKSPNGILYDAANQRLVWVTWGSNAPIMQVLLADSSVSQVTATSLSNCDGIDRDGSGRYYVSAWGTQSVVRFDSAFSTTPVPVVSGLSNPADIYYNTADDTLVSPNSGNNTVSFHFMGNPTGVEEFSSSSFAMHPNPANSSLFVSSENPIRHLEVYNGLGQSVYSYDAETGNPSVILTVSHLDAGVYWVKVTAGNKASRQLLVVSR